jgi:hypothetical protein
MQTMVQLWRKLLITINQFEQKQKQKQLTIYLFFIINKVNFIKNNQFNETFNELFLVIEYI